MRNWNIFGAQINHKQTCTYNIHHNSDLGEAITFPLIVFYVPSHGPCTQMSFCPRTPKLGISKFLKLGFAQFWKPITSYVDHQLR